MLHKIFISILIGYALGCMNVAYYYAKRRGENIFSLGSSNAGATNIARNYGLKAGIWVGLLDGFKMIVALWIVQHLLAGSTQFLALTALSCICGHIFPWQLGFNGGKGAACLLTAGIYFLPYQAIMLLTGLFLGVFLLQKNYKKAAFVTMLIW